MNRHTCARIGHEQWKKLYIIPYIKGNGISIMIWAEIWGNGYTEIYRMSQDEESARKGCSSVLKIIEENLPVI